MEELRLMSTDADIVEIGKYDATLTRAENDGTFEFKVEKV
jgi:hypothetical protein